MLQVLFTGETIKNERFGGLEHFLNCNLSGNDVYLYVYYFQSFFHCSPEISYTVSYPVSVVPSRFFKISGNSFALQFYEIFLNPYHITFSHHETIMHERVLRIKFPGSNTTSSKGDNMNILKFYDIEDYSIELFVRGAFMIGFFF